MSRTARPLATFVAVVLAASLLPLLGAAPALAGKPGGGGAIKITDALVLEGNAGQKALSFKVSASVKKGTAVSVSYATADGSATAGADYQAKSGTVALTGGCRCATVTVQVLGDLLIEGDETFTVTLTNPAGATIGDAQGIGTIDDDDVVPTVSVGDTTVAEDGGPASFTVSLSAATGSDVEVAYATADGSAVAGEDHGAASGTATVPAGATSVEVDVPILDDPTYEGDESFGLTLSDPVGATIADGAATATITDDEGVPAVSIDDVSVTEGAGGTTPATFTVALSGPSAFGASVAWATADGTATAGDYAAASGIVTFTPGDASETVSVDVAGDSDVEEDETFTVVLSVPSGAVLADDTGVATIVDDDRTPTALTLKVGKAKTKLRAKGVLESAEADSTVTVTLYRKKGAGWVRVGPPRPVGVRLLGDRDHDGTPDAAYRTTFARPKPGRYQIRVAFGGSATLMPNARAISFRL